MSKPFISFVTRCCKRPDMLRKNIESVNALKDGDWEHIFLVDTVGKGVKWANKQFHKYRKYVRGEYVYILDDDVVLSKKASLKRVKRIAKTNPAIIMVKGDCEKRGILPKNQYWGNKKKLRCPCINCTNYIVRSDIWKKHIKSFGYPDTLRGAWMFPASLLKQNYKFVWLDVLFASIIRISRGKVNQKLGEDWFADFMHQHDYKLEKLSENVWRRYGLTEGN